MPVYTVVHLVATEYERDDEPGAFDRPRRRTEPVAVGRLAAASSSAARRQGLVRWPAPDGRFVSAQETPASRLVRRWLSVGDHAFDGRLDDYDGLLSALDDDLLDDARWPLTLAALCDLAGECGVLPVQRRPGQRDEAGAVLADTRHLLQATLAH
jgi:hypothetical protein